MFKGKWRRQTKVPRTFREEDLQCLLDFVIDNSHFEINGYLFRQERGVAMGSPAAPPLCNLVATVEGFFWHQTMATLRFEMPDFGVIWHEHYVDNRFILLRDAAPSTAVLRNFLPLEFYRFQSCWRRKMTPKCLGTCVIQAPGLSHYSCPIILLRSKRFEVPMIRCLLTPRGHLDRGSSWSSTSNPPTDWP